TFIIIAKRFGKKYINRFSATRSFFIFPPWNIVRRIALYIATHQLFDLFIIFTILVNCVFLAMPELSWADTAEYVFLGIYITEMIIKVVARGFFINKYTYLRDPWNWLDFIVIVSAVVTLLIQAADPNISVGNLTGLRTFRVFRALRTVSIVPGLKTIVNALLGAFKMLFEVIILTVFCLMVFALFALQVYMGALRQKCVKDIGSYTATPSLNYDQYYAMWIRDTSNWQLDDEGEFQLCGNASGTGSCSTNYTCLKNIGENPNYGYTNFDHFGWAMLTSFQLLTLDFWEDAYNKITRTSGPWNVIFFLIVVFFGSFYLLNLMLAVVAMSYEEEAISAGKEKEREDEASKKKRHNAIYDLAVLTVKSKHVSEHVKAEVEKHHDGKDHPSMTSPRARVDSKSTANKRAGGPRKPTNSQKITVSPAKKQPVNPLKPLVKNASIDSGFSTHSQRSVNKPAGKHLVHQNSREVLRNPEDAETASEGSGPEMTGRSGTGTVGSHVSFKDSTSVMEYKQRNPLVKQESQGTVSSSGIFIDKDGMSSMSGEDSYREKDGEPIIVTADELDDQDDDPEGKLVDRNCACCRGCCKCYEPWLRLQNLIHIVVSDPLFDFGITLCIILNTVFLAIEHHNQPDGMTTALKVANYLFREDYKKYDFDGSEGERWNFKDFFHSFMMVFRILCGEWIEPLWECMRAANELCMVVFLPALVIGNFIVLNLFLALLLNAFASGTIDKHKEENEASKIKLAIERIKHLCCCCIPFAKKNTVKPTKDKPNEPDPLINTVIPELDEEGDATGKEIKTTTSSKAKAANGLTDGGTGTPRTNGVVSADSFKTSNKRMFPSLTEVKEKGRGAEKSKVKDADKVVDYRWFEYLILFLIFSSSITLISVASLIGESLGVSNITAFRSLRTLRALRPLRAISRWESMKIVVNSLMRAIPSIFNVFLVGMVFWLIFSILGVQFFAGKFYKCVNATSGEILDYTVVPNKTYCISLGERWQNSKINFDNAGAGFLALFQVATFEGWMEVMQDAVDSTEVDEQPKFENSLYLGYIYFVVFIIVGSFFTLNLFIGVIIDNFNALKKKYDGSYLDAFLTTSQRNYYNTLKKLGNKKPQKTIKRPKNKFQIFFYNIAMSTKFEMAVVLLIFLNMIVMAVEHYNQTDGVKEALKIMNIIFTTVFGLEATVKLIGLRWHYFRVPWNIFDFIVVILSVVGIILDDILADAFVNPTLLRVVRVFRIGRVLRLIKAAKGIRKLLFALIISLPAIFNIGALLLLVMYIYAIIGMSSFGDVKLTGKLNDLVNFQTFYKSFLLLIRLATSAGWNDILEPLLITAPDCDPDYRTLPDGTKEKSTYGDCGILWLAIPYMVSYIVIIYLIVINMYIAVILENFNQAHQQEEVGITEDDFDMFYNTWERYDPHATQFIKYDELSDFVADLDDPLKIEKPNEITLVSFNLNIVEGDRLHCLDVLMALVNNLLRDVEQTEELKTLKSQMEAKFTAVFPTRETMTVKSTTLQRKKEDVAARTLQRAWRSHKTQKALKNIVALGMRQNSMRRNSAVSTRERVSGIRELGRRLSHALANFFGASRPSSAVSHISVQSPPSSPRAGNHTHLQTLSKQGKLGNTLQVPSVKTLYGTDKAAQDLEL
ncbi:hypothetical protein BaRGS_00016159, partial [Batillaria attramentaria]